MQVETAASPAALPLGATQTQLTPFLVVDASHPTPQNGSAPPGPPDTAAPNGQPAISESQPVRDAPQPEYRATAEDFVLWAVIAAVLAYFGWHLHSVSAVLEKIADIDRLAVYGMNERADLMLLIGAALTLLGCMIVLRRVRTSFSANAALEGTRAQIVADSAGVVIVVLGVLLLTIVVTHPPRFEHGGGSAGGSTNSADRRARDLEGKLKDIRAQQAQDRPETGHGGTQ